MTASGSAPTEHDTTEAQEVAAALAAGWSDHWANRPNDPLFADILAAIAPLIAARVRTAQADAWDEGYAAGNAFGYEYAQDTYDGPLEDPTPNPYRADRLHDTATNNRGNQ